MRTETLVALLFCFSCFYCAVGPDPELAADMPEQPAHMVYSVGFIPTILDVDLAQRTCALYVAVRSHAWSGEVPFGHEIDDSMLPWNKCPGGTMVACKKEATANGNSVMTGIPWPYGEGGVE